MSRRDPSRNSAARDENRTTSKNDSSSPSASSSSLQRYPNNNKSISTKKSKCTTTDSPEFDRKKRVPPQQQKQQQQQQKKHGDRAASSGGLFGPVDPHGADSFSAVYRPYPHYPAVNPAAMLYNSSPIAQSSHPYWYPPSYHPPPPQYPMNHPSLVTAIASFYHHHRPTLPSPSSAATTTDFNPNPQPFSYPPPPATYYPPPSLNLYGNSTPGPHHHQYGLQHSSEGSYVPQSNDLVSPSKYNRPATASASPEATSDCNNEMSFFSSSDTSTGNFKSDVKSTRLFQSRVENRSSLSDRGSSSRISIGGGSDQLDGSSSLFSSTQMRAGISQGRPNIDSNVSKSATAVVHISPMYSQRARARSTSSAQTNSTTTSDSKKGTSMQQQQEKNETKLAKSRMRSRTRKAIYEELQANDPQKLTEKESQFLNEYQTYVLKKRIQSRNRDRYTKERMTAILQKAESQRDEDEKQFLELCILRKKKKKNEKDRLRQRRLRSQQNQQQQQQQDKQQSSTTPTATTRTGSITVPTTEKSIGGYTMAHNSEHTDASMSAASADEKSKAPTKHDHIPPVKKGISKKRVILERAKTVESIVKDKDPDNKAKANSSPG